MLHRAGALGALLFLIAMGTGRSQAEESAREIMCRLVDRAAEAHALPPSFLTRLIWRESSFRPDVQSRAGAQGIAQFMPSTAKEHGLVDPFDPEQAIPASASFVSALYKRFGSLDLAAAAYNAGPARIVRWTAGEVALPQETRAHVRFITGASATASRTFSGGREWETDAGDGCLVTLAAIQVEGPSQAGKGLTDAIAPWGVQLTAGSDKEQVLDRFSALQTQFRTVLADQQPTILSTRLGGRGHRMHYRIRVAFAKRASAEGLCRSLRQAGGACLTVRN